MTANNIQDYQMFIDGQWTEAENNQRFESTNPENNKPWSSFPDATVNDVNNAVAAAKNAFRARELHWFVIALSPIQWKKLKN